VRQLYAANRSLVKKDSQHIQFNSGISRYNWTRSHVEGELEKGEDMSTLAFLPGSSPPTRSDLRSEAYLALSVCALPEPRVDAIDALETDLPGSKFRLISENSCHAGRSFGDFFVSQPFPLIGWG
jgi:hypothetical protein